MDRYRAEKLLQAMVDAKQEFDREWGRLADVIGCDCDSAFGNAAWKPVELLVDAVAELVGDPFHTVSWYVWDNECGEKGLEHTYSDGSFRAVFTVCDLLDVLGVVE